jgi:hypothetical protein
MVCPLSSGSDYRLAPLTLVLGNRTRTSPAVDDWCRRRFRVFWSNGLVGAITTLALVPLFWPMIGGAFDKMKGLVATKKPVA